MTTKQWPEMLQVKDLRDFLGISNTTLYRLRMGEDFPKPRRPTGKVAMYVTEEVREWMRSLKKRNEKHREASHHNEIFYKNSYTAKKGAFRNIKAY